MDYVVAGNVMIDHVRYVNGTTNERAQIGGPATFAYSGVRVWTDSVIQVSNVGEDYHSVFDQWIDKNKFITEGLKVKCDFSNHCYLIYNEDGTYGVDESVERFRDDWIQDFGYLKTTPEEIGQFTYGQNVKGIYLAQNCDYVYWRKLGEIKQRDGFKIMWEIEAPSSYKKHLDAVLNALKSVDFFSINLKEAKNLFGVNTEEECLEELKQLPVDMTLFRVGKKGLYTICDHKAYLIPSAPTIEKDPTGCGNTSTGSALYAYCENKDPVMVGIMANVASGLNIRQFGVIPDFGAVREFAMKQAEELYASY
jgi:sugar/nucleoside kinase (ribokinase family)